MAVRSAGVVSPVPKGVYDPTQTYNRLNIVTYAGGSYIAKQFVPVNTAPSSTSDYWQWLAGLDSSNFMTSAELSALWNS